MRVTLVRHGQSEWNAVERLQGQADIGLSDLGRKQARALKPLIAMLKPCRTIASDLLRVRQTVDALELEDTLFDGRLREVNVGDWTGRSIPDLLAEDETRYLDWRAGIYTPPGSESWTQFSSRTSEVVREVAERPCKNLLLICHDGVIRALINYFVGLDPSRLIAAAPASCTAFILKEKLNTQARLELFNYRPLNLDFDAPD